LKYAATRPYADPEKARRRIVEIASTVEAVQDGCTLLQALRRLGCCLIQKSELGPSPRSPHGWDRLDLRIVDFDAGALVAAICVLLFAI
jgi:hypothetical protein